MGWSVAPGMWDALANRDDNRAYYTLSGDLGQMGTMYRFLLDRGYPVVKWDVHPGFAKDQEAQYIRALRDIFEWRVEGWWNQERDLVKYGVCTQEAYDLALGRQR